MQQAIDGGGVTGIGIHKLTQGGYLYETFEHKNPFGQ